MGIARAMAKFLLMEKKKNPFEGSVLQLGKQDVYFSFIELETWANELEVKLSKVEEVAFSSKPDFAEKGYIDDVTLFKALGFTSVESCDISDYENSTHVFNLNVPVPDRFSGQYDMILDGGTIEHIFNIPQVMSNIHKMLKLGGRSIHATPSSNHVDHGYYMLSPIMFYDYYSANRYDISSYVVAAYSVEHSTHPWAFYDYEPGSINHLSFGGFSRKNFPEPYDLFAILCSAIKTERSTSDVIPIQGHYQKEKTEEVSGYSPRKFELIGYF